MGSPTPFSMNTSAHSIPGGAVGSPGHGGVERDRQRAEILLSRLALQVREATGEKRDDDPAHIRNASRYGCPFGLDRLWVGREGRRTSGPREMPADQLPFFKIQIAVFDDRRAFPISKIHSSRRNPSWWVTFIVFGEPQESSTCLIHTDHHTMAFNML